MKISAVTWGRKMFNRNHKEGKVSGTYLYLQYNGKNCIT